MKTGINIILFATVLVSCHFKKDVKPHESNSEVQMLKDFITKSDTAYMLKYDATIFHLDILINEYCVNNNIHKALVYILNSECSICLEKMFNFLFQFKECDQTIPIIVVAEVGNKEILRYYTDNVLFEDMNLIFIENTDNKYVKGKLESNNGKIFYIYNNKIINSFTY